MPESEEAKAAREAEQRHSEALEAASAQIINTLPRMFRSIKHEMRNSVVETTNKEMGEQQIGILYTLKTQGSLLTSELAKKFDVTNPTITRTVDRLVEMGYVERQPDADDRRKIYLRLTPEGVKMGEYSHAQFRAAMSRSLSMLTDGQLYDIALACRHLGTLFPEDLYESETACPVRPGGTELGTELARARLAPK